MTRWAAAGDLTCNGKPRIRLIAGMAQGIRMACRIAKAAAARRVFFSPNRSLVPLRGYGYTHGMKTAISIPDMVYQEAERLARRTKKSRSRLYGDALKEYLARHAPDEVTEAMNRACAEVGEMEDPFVSSATRRILERSEW